MVDTVTVTWGLMKVSPERYNNFDIGPFEMTTVVKDGETPEQAMARAYAACEAFARKSYATKIAAFKVALQESSAAMKSR
jgi:organic hydroperoxide reductase OsmC/OhrA